MTIDSLVTTAVALLLLLGVPVCLRQAVLGFRTGRLWIDPGLDSDESQPHPLIGGRARVLASVYLLTAIGCVLALLDLWRSR